METINYKLPKEFLTKWLEALRSGEYEQGLSRMYQIKEDSYCCLGVAGLVCDIPKTSLNYPYFGIKCGFETLGVPEELIHIDGNRTDLASQCMKLNDSLCGKTFPVIADWLEQNVEPY